MSRESDRDNRASPTRPDGLHAVIHEQRRQRGALESHEYEMGRGAGKHEAMTSELVHGLAAVAVELREGREQRDADARLVLVALGILIVAVFAIPAVIVAAHLRWF